MLAGVISFVVVLVISLLGRLVRKYDPQKSTETTFPGEKIVWLKAKYKNNVGWFLLIFFSTVIGVGICWFYILSFIGDVLTKPGLDVLFQIDPGHFFWSAPSMLLGIVCSAPAASYICRSVFPSWYPDYEILARQESPINARGMLLGVAAFVVVVCAIFFVFQVNDVTRLRASNISLGHFGSFAHPVYRYTDLKSVTFTPLTRDAEGHVQDRPRWDIQFSDGTTWTTESFWRDMNTLKDREAFQYASAQAGLSIEKR